MHTVQSPWLLGLLLNLFQISPIDSFPESVFTSTPVVSDGPFSTKYASAKIPQIVKSMKKHFFSPVQADEKDLKNTHHTL